VSGMTDVMAARRQLEEAAGLELVLDAAYAGFEAIMSSIWDHEERAGDSFAAFDFAAAAAADGRDAVAAAPSLSAAPHAGHRADPGAQDPKYAAGELEAALAGLAGLLANRLGQAAEAAARPGDRAACEVAARHAAEIRGLLAGDRS